MKTCATCRYFVSNEGEQSQCRRYPPTAFVLPRPMKMMSGETMGLVPVSAYPPVSRDHGCGEYATNIAEVQPSSVDLESKELC